MTVCRFRSAVACVLLVLGLSACAELAGLRTSDASSAGEHVEDSAPLLPATAEQVDVVANVPAPVDSALDTVVPVSDSVVPALTLVEQEPPQLDTVPPLDTSAPSNPSAEPAPLRARDGRVWQASVDTLCEQIGNKLGSVSVEDCAEQDFIFGGGFSVNQRPLVIKEHLPANGASDFRVLIMGGIHGDEYSSISILFKWLALYSSQATEGTYHWRFAPLVNPDGLLDGSQARRQNANGVDLNRNFPSHDWNDAAVRYWQESTGRNPRRFPGEHAGSEPEVQWVVQQIEEFQPHVIVSVHAPYHLLDFDGPAEAPAKIGELYLHQLGVYPGSLGNFAGLNRRIPVVTLELPSAGIMPPAEQIDLMWHDLVAWLEREGRKGLSSL